MVYFLSSEPKIITRAKNILIKLLNFLLILVIKLSVLSSNY
jgi:hypothetical protein